ncbi:MAG: DUF2149 domain-containing protein [Colwellia sp.]
MRLLDEDEAMNPALSVVNLVDVFLVVIAALLIAIAQNPLNPFLAEDVTVIKNAGKDNMEIIVKKGNKIEHFKSEGKTGSGTGKKAGTAYEMADGSIIYVEE